MPPQATQTAAKRLGMEAYSLSISRWGTLANASRRASHKASLFWNMRPWSMRPTMGQTCSMGLRSGLCAGQTPLLNIRTPLLLNQRLVELLWCTGAPSCWKNQRVALRSGMRPIHVGAWVSYLGLMNVILLASSRWYSTLFTLGGHLRTIAASMSALVCSTNLPAPQNGCCQ